MLETQVRIRQNDYQKNISLDELYDQPFLCERSIPVSNYVKAFAFARHDIQDTNDLEQGISHDGKQGTLEGKSKAHSANRIMDMAMILNPFSYNGDASN